MGGGDGSASFQGSGSVNEVGVVEELVHDDIVHWGGGRCGRGLRQ